MAVSREGGIESLPYVHEVPDFVASKQEIAWIEESALQSGSGSWEHLGLIDSNDTGKPRTTMPALQRSLTAT